MYTIRILQLIGFNVNRSVELLLVFERECYQYGYLFSIKKIKYYDSLKYSIILQSIHILFNNINKIFTRNTTPPLLPIIKLYYNYVCICIIHIIIMCIVCIIHYYNDVYARARRAAVTHTPTYYIIQSPARYVLTCATYAHLSLYTTRNEQRLLCA